ncbi:MAG: hypothetical protein NVS3B3_21590 [Aquirhabdus sp.]
MSRSKDRALKTAKQSRGGGQFLPLTLEVLRSQALAKLSPHASKLLLDIASQWKLGSNGDSCAAFEKVLRDRGWRSKATLHKALRELLASGLVVQTRQGSLHQCSLFALGWLAIDVCGGKLDVHSTMRPINNWLDPIKPKENKTSSTARVPKPIKNSDLGTPRVLDG